MRLYNFFEDLEICARALTGDFSLRFIWKELPPNMGAGFDFITNTIVMPKTNFYDLDYKTIRKLRHLSYHERLHHALTHFDPIKKAGGFDIDPQTKKPIKVPSDPNAKIKPGEFLKTLLNFLEDCRIEKNKHYRLPGDIEDTIWYRTEVEYKDYLSKWKEIQTFNPFGSLMVNFQFRICNYGEFPIAENLQTYFDLAWNILNDGRYHDSLNMKREGTEVMLKLAEEIAEAWKQEFDQDEEMKKRCKIEEEQSENDEEKEIKGKIKNKHIKIRPAKNGEKGTNLTEVEFENCTFELDEMFEQDQDKDEEKYSVNPNKLNQEMGNLAREEESEPENKNKNEIQGNPAQCNRKPLPDELKKILSKMNKLPKRNDPYVPYHVTDQIIIANKEKENYEYLKKSIHDKMIILKNELARILIAQRRNGVERNLKSGQLDSSNLYKLTYGNPRIFSRHTKGEKTKPAVQLVIDLSGSMQGKKVLLAAQIATLFAEVLDAINIPFEIIGFNTVSPLENHQKDAIEGGYDCAQDCIIKWIFKEFKEPFSLVKERLGSCYKRLSYKNAELTQKTYKCGAAGGCNVDHEVILWGAKRLSLQDVDKRIQIVLSDGLPSGFGNYNDLLERMLKKVNKNIKKAGIYQFAFGIQCEEVCHYYPHHKYIKNLDTFNLEAIKCLSSLLLRKNK